MPEALSREALANRAGVTAARVDELVRLGILAPRDGGSFTEGDARRIRMVGGLIEGGLPLEAIGAAVGGGLLSLDFADTEVFRRFSVHTPETFADVSARTGIPLELLAVVRESIGIGPFSPDAHLREDELEVIPFLELQVRAGFHHAAIERLFRTTADSLRRVAEAEAQWFRTEIAEPLLREGRPNDIAGFDGSLGLSIAEERALLASYRAQQAQTWMSNLVEGFHIVLARAGIHDAAERDPAICFLDITGYTRLTQERGDSAAAELAEVLGRLVNRRSGEHGGRPVKWLGDGVMFHFRDPAGAVEGALEMVHGVVEAGLPPAHVGVHTGPVVLQGGDYYGQTVNLAARIAEYARPGEVLVSEPVRSATTLPAVAFTDIGTVELKGVSGAIHLFNATAA